MQKFDNDFLYEDLRDLVNQEYKGWYMRAFYAIGKDEVLRLASIARADGKDKRRYFSKLINNAYKQTLSIA